MDYNQVWFSPSKNEEEKNPKISSSSHRSKTLNFAKKIVFLTLLAHSSEKLDLFRRWNLRYILKENLEKKRKHMCSMSHFVTIFRNTNIAQYFGRDNSITYDLEDYYDPKNALLIQLVIIC